MGLVRKNAGDTIGAADANQQFYDILTGVDIDWVYLYHNTSGLLPVSGSGLAIGSNYTGNSEVDFFNRVNAAVHSFRFYQKTGTSTAVLLATMYPSGGLYLGSTPADPGANNLQVQGSILASGPLVASGRLQANQGADVASTSNLVLGTDGNVFRITGTTTINRIDRTGWQIGSLVTLVFAGSLTVTNAASISGNNLPFVLNAAANFGAVADNTLTLRLMGNPIANPLWYEVARKV